MRRISFLAVAIAATFLVAGLSAQNPNFAGKWTQVVDPNAPAPGAGGGGGGGRGGGRGGGGGQFCGQECTIAQDAATITITRTTQAGEQKAVYNLNGSESKNAGRGGEVVSKAMWEGGKLVISTAQPGRDGGPGVTVKTTVSMSGGNMEVETDAGRGPQKTTYKKG
jgi:hypothetical protein